MKNTVTTYTPRPHTRLGSYRKEAHGLHKQYTLIDLNPERRHISPNGVPQYPSVGIVRIYWPAQTAYACVWLSFADSYTIGKGKAGGCGYCKESAAIDEALRSAGVQLEHSIHGVGESAIWGALVAIAEYAGLTNYTITVSHA